MPDPRVCRRPFPFRHHLSLAEVWRLEELVNGPAPKFYPYCPPFGSQELFLLIDRRRASGLPGLPAKGLTTPPDAA